MNKHKNRLLVVVALIVGMFFALSGVMTAQADAPNNDNIASATYITVTDLPFSDSYDTTDATVDPADPNPWCLPGGAVLRRTVWYTYETNRTMSVYLSAVNTNYSYLISIYDGSPNNLNSVVCNTGDIVFSAYSGRTYYIMIAEYYSESPYPPPQIDQYSLLTQFIEISGIANDYFDNRTLIATMPYNDQVDVSNAWFEPFEPWPSCSFDYPSHSIWYEYRPNRDGILQGSTDNNGSTAVWEGSSLESLHELSCSTGGNTLSLPVTEGQAYYVQFSYPYYSTYNGVHLSFTAPPENDAFAKSTVISQIPFNTGDIDLSLATSEPMEHYPSCIWSGLNNTIWYKYVPTETRSVMFDVSWEHYAAVYTGSSINTLSEIGCVVGGRVTKLLNAGTSYYIQLGPAYPWYGPGSVSLSLDVPPSPIAGFGYNPADPSVFDEVGFWDGSSDPANGGIASWMWNFGDGTTSTGNSVSHRYTQDGTYTVEHTITTLDGRSATTTQTVAVRTHDVAITRFGVPTSASAGQTRQINVEINNKRYPETVRVDLYRSTPAGDVLVGTLYMTVPVRSSNRTTVFAFSYTFTASDAAVGKVTFRAVASIEGARDALQADNQAISTPVKVGR